MVEECGICGEKNKPFCEACSDRQYLEDDHNARINVCNGCCECVRANFSSTGLATHEGLPWCDHSNDPFQTCPVCETPAGEH